MKKYFILAGIAACSVALAKPVPKEAEPVTGGPVCKPGSQRGEVCYVNCQNAAPEAWLKFSADYFTEETKFKISLKKGDFKLPNPQIQGTASLFIVDDATLPPLLSAPESWWAVVNIAPLKCADQTVFESRVKKELSRGFAFLCGGAESQFPGSLMSVAKTEMLDKQEDHRLPMDVLSRFPEMMANVGVAPAIYDEYLYACEEGWAPTPTNDVQKAIWDKVHTPPKAPMKIEFDPKKGR